ncbi:STAS domain-containing protein [Terribacillus saccharophilus]|uniref:STAS domain-containing protein n=1 Tax=Terribacillus saccharophilus TaxID=361277 RepID=UPI002989EFC7|nr:STAS domain-containing protein [Terribacillus saccharophilus]MCM3224212.1 STAS domain-containing protein [Terribacillus saccharophilus]MEC0283872.1 STAS domain-containing protein [Terribacillus saccharophilus]MEC0290828.1 STAS domain-containing protein [Terribacillus saccharophilus]
MKDELRYIGEKIQKNQDIIAESVLLNLDSTLNKELRILSLPKDQLSKFNSRLVSNIGAILFAEENKAEVEKSFLAWGSWAGKAATEMNVSLTATLQYVSSFRSVIWDIFTVELEERHFAAITMLDVSKIIDPMLEIVSFEIGRQFEKHNKKMVSIAYSALEELSVPVVPIYEGLAVIPIVGEIDTHRAKLIMETALTQGNALELDQLVLDVSGVLMIDTMVANQILQIVQTLRISGIKTIITGIRPEIAQTMVSLGLEFNSITTISNLKNALNQLGYGKLDTSKKS